MPERKLNENYWNKYRYYKNDKLIRDGIKFEDLIEQLLQFEYGKRWKRTRKSHDDNRDFYLIDKDILKWAECKNYEETIAMSTIAPTLVMAQIYDVSKIIFFSYSKINQRAQTKLYSFAEKTGKSIQIYDADLLDGLIIKHRNLLSPRFKPDNEMIITDSVENLPKTNFYFIKTPVLGSTLDNRDLCNLNKIKKIQYNVIFEICFVILNNSLIDDYHITVSLHPDYYENNCYYTIMDVDLKNDNPVYDVHVDSASGIVQRIFLKSNKFKKNLLLPVFRVEIYKNEKLNLSYTSEIVKVNNIWIGKTVLIGEQYRHILNKFEENLIGNDSISCLLVHGNSGTGKTRLLNESIDILFKYRYRIINFIGNEHDETHIILKEIIYFIYEIPNQEILMNLERRLSKIDNDYDYNAYDKALNLAYLFQNVKSDVELTDIIDRYFDVLYEKLSQQKIAIIIDNIQFFSEPLLHFLYNYINYSKFQTRRNYSILILSVNHDYMSDKTRNFINYIKQLEQDRSEIYTARIKGFSTVNQGILFLRELLNITNSDYDEAFKIILNKTSLIPFHIYQAIYYLYEKKVIESYNEKGYIISTDLFFEKVEEMPEQISFIIEKRWQFFLKSCTIDHNEIVRTLSAIYIFQNLEYACQQLLQLDKAIIDNLINRDFLKYDKKKAIIFSHDIIESFFLQYYRELHMPIIEYMNKSRNAVELNSYALQKNFCILYNIPFNKNDLDDILFDCNNLTVPFRLFIPYYGKMFDVLLGLSDLFISLPSWLHYVNIVCLKIKNKFGMIEAKKYYEKLNYSISRKMCSDLLYSKEFRNYLNAYSDLLFHQNLKIEAIDYLDSILKMTNKSQEKSDRYFALCAMIYNRLLINHRELNSSYHIEQSWLCLKISKEYVNKIEEENLRNEFTYLNISDEGYFYYCFQKDEEKLLSIWKKCLYYTPNILPQKTLNYFRKCIQLSLIERDLDNALNNIEQAKEYLRTGLYSDEKLVFQSSLICFELTVLMMDNPIKNYDVIQKKINICLENIKMMGGKKLYRIFMLRGILYYYLKNHSECFFSFKEAYEAYSKEKYGLLYNENMLLLCDNIKTAFYNLHMCNKIKEIEGNELLKRVVFKTKLHKAVGILRTSDDMFNLPVF